MARVVRQHGAARTACAIVATSIPALSGCLGPGTPVVVEQPAPVAAGEADCAGVDCVTAAAREVDITPPPGLPTYGYSTNGTVAALGTWLRLKARVLALHAGENLVVLVQADLGASSSIVHRKLAAALAAHGVTPANLMFAATHTHGGPGGFHGERFYNGAVAARPGYVPEYVERIVAHMASTVIEALSDMKPARLGVATAQVGIEAAHNRSIEAWRRNYVDLGVVPDDDDAVERTLTLLRVDRKTAGCDEDECYAPLASWSVFGVHATGIPAGYTLYHGDVHGLAARILSGWVASEYDLPASQRFVAATATGPEGDVGPGSSPTLTRGRNFAIRVATAEARAAFEAFRSLDGRLRTATSIRYAYAEKNVRGATTSLGRVCREAQLGSAQLAGSEESRGPVPFFDIAEGLPGPNSGCHGTKAGFEILQSLIYSDDAFPDVLPLQVIAFGAADDASGLVLAGVPGEPTTEVGRSITRAIRDRLRDGVVRPVPRVAVVAMANAYTGYVTMPGEYLAQHYEGGATIFGPFEGQFMVEELKGLAGSIEEGHPETDYPRRRTFQPGATEYLWPVPDHPSPCAPARWRRGDRSFEEKGANGVRLELPFVVFRWEGSSEDEDCGPPEVSAECVPPGGPAWVFEKVADDHGIDFEVWRTRGRAWRARWITHGTRGQTCRLVVGYAGQRFLASDEFELGRKE